MHTYYQKILSEVGLKEKGKVPLLSFAVCVRDLMCRGLFENVIFVPVCYRKSSEVLQNWKRSSICIVLMSTLSIFCFREVT